MLNPGKRQEFASGTRCVSEAKHLLEAKTSMFGNFKQREKPREKDTLIKNEENIAKDYFSNTIMKFSNILLTIQLIKRKKYPIMNAYQNTEIITALGPNFKKFFNQTGTMII